MEISLKNLNEEIDNVGSFIESSAEKTKQARAKPKPASTENPTQAQSLTKIKKEGSSKCKGIKSEKSEVVDMSAPFPDVEENSDGEDESLASQKIKEVLSSQLVVIWEVTDKERLNCLSSLAYNELLNDPVLPYNHLDPVHGLCTPRVLKQSIRDGLTFICRENGFKKMNSLSTMSASFNDISMYFAKKNPDLAALPDDVEEVPVVTAVSNGIHDLVHDITCNPANYNADAKRGAFWYSLVSGYESVNGELPLAPREAGNTSPFVLFTTKRFALPVVP
jgi:hypothetical protein